MLQLHMLGCNGERGRERERESETPMKACVGLLAPELRTRHTVSHFLDYLHLKITYTCLHLHEFVHMHTCMQSAYMRTQVHHVGTSVQPDLADGQTHTIIRTDWWKRTDGDIHARTSKTCSIPDV